MIKDFICKDCTKYYVCNRVKVISKFDIEAKKPMGVDIQLLTCDEYEVVKNTDE